MLRIKYCISRMFNTMCLLIFVFLCGEEMEILKRRYRTDSAIEAIKCSAEDAKRRFEQKEKEKDPETVEDRKIGF